MDGHSHVYTMIAICLKFIGLMGINVCSLTGAIVYLLSSRKEVSNYSTVNHKNNFANSLR